MLRQLGRKNEDFIMGERNLKNAYTLVPGVDDDNGDVKVQQLKARGRLRRRIASVTGILVLLLLTIGLFGRGVVSKKCDKVRKGYQCQPEISHYWGQYSPYFSVPSDIAPGVPKGCRISFVQVLSRHGGRDPTSGKTILYGATIQRIQNTIKHFSGSYSFLNDYKYTLGADQLTTFGQQQMVNSGTAFYRRYKSLTKDYTPFVRASDQNRVVESGQNFTQGYHEARKADSSSSVPDDYPYPIILISEAHNRNNTLSNDLCTVYRTPPYSHIGHHAQKIWLEIFAKPIAGRLNADLPDLNLSHSEIVYLMDMCPFDTIANSKGSISPFCALFTEEEWHQYDYFETLGKYYGYSNGNPMASTQGVGFVNELIARMTGKPVKDHTSVNHTMDDSDETFPIGEGNVLFADFSHDNDMSTIFSAFGLYNTTKPLSNTSIETTEESNGFSAGWTVPFAARTYFEKMQCIDEEEEMVRILVNDRVLPMETCGGDPLGRCTLSKFVDSLSFARAGGRWDECFA